VVDKKEVIAVYFKKIKEELISSLENRNVETGICFYHNRGNLWNGFYPNR